MGEDRTDQPTRASINEIAECVMSIPIHLRFSFCATSTAVPHPQNGP